MVKSSCKDLYKMECISSVRGLLKTNMFLETKDHNGGICIIQKT